MKIGSLFNFFSKKNKSKEQDINIQVKQLADLFVQENKEHFSNLDFSLESLSFIDQIFKTTPIDKNEYVADKYCHKCEKIAAYLLQTLKENFKGYILWRDNNQLIFLFDNYKEFTSYKYVREQFINDDDVIDTAGFFKKLSN